MEGEGGGVAQGSIALIKQSRRFSIRHCQRVQVPSGGDGQVPH